MGEFLARRAAATLLTLLGALIAVFLLVRLVPGDPALLYLGDNYTPESYREVRHVLGLDRPVLGQLAHFLRQVAAGEFGSSFRTHRPVLRELLDQFPYTIVLAVSGLVVAVLIGVPSGVIAALKRMVHDFQQPEESTIPLRIVGAGSAETEQPQRDAA